jgi:phospholipid/cholesterol/gamma-HCH transport system substrate-binding protein
VSLATQLRRYAKELAAVIGLIVIALVVGGYVLSNQRLRFPWEDVYEIRAEFSTGQALTPGQGQTLGVAGVDVGEVTGVRLRDGRALVTFEVDRTKLPRVFADAEMLMRPKTGLQDMTVQLDPGTRAAGDLGDATVPVSRTQPSVNLDEVLAGLDADTRRWLQMILQASGEGLKGRARDLQKVLAAGAPTLRRTERVTQAIVARRGELRRLVGSLRTLATAAAGQDEDLRTLVSAGDATFGALGDQEAALRTTLQRLPGTLEAAGDALGAARPLARRLPAAQRDLQPALEDLARALPEVEPLLVDARPQLRRLRGLAVAARPVLRDARPALRDLRAQTPDLADAFRVLNLVVNELGHNPDGPEEGYLFWLAWFAHNGNSMLSQDDATGTSWRGMVALGCSTAAAPTQLAPQLEAILKPLLDSALCPEDRSGEGVR